MEKVFTSGQELAIMIVDWFPSSVRLRWTRGSWCIAVQYCFLSIAITKSWYDTCKLQMKRKRESIVAGSNLGNVQMADICFERDPVDVEQRSYNCYS